jgi:hypothetical protein
MSLCLCLFCVKYELTTTHNNNIKRQVLVFVCLDHRSDLFYLPVSRVYTNLRFKKGKKKAKERKRVEIEILQF